MAKAKKINKAELEAIKDLIATRTEIIKVLGELELKKLEVASKFSEVEESLMERKDSLEQKYGHININLSTGEYEEVKEE
jgi:hypothetical protein